MDVQELTYINLSTRYEFQTNITLVVKQEQQRNFSFEKRTKMYIFKYRVRKQNLKYSSIITNDSIIRQDYFNFTKQSWTKRR